MELSYGIAMIEDTQCLVHGYLRELKEIPMDIIQFIDALVYIEYLYVIENSEDQTFCRICVDEILCSLLPRRSASFMLMNLQQLIQS